MAFDKRLLDILVCPQSKRPLQLAPQEKSLWCEYSKLNYPIYNDIPVLIVEEATRQGQALAATSSSPRAAFRIVRGNGQQFFLERGTCKALGRGEQDEQKTSMFRVDLALNLDENTKALVVSYINRQFRTVPVASSGAGERLGGFRRTSDVVIPDANLSRLHAMVFQGMNGEVGILDLVSKNGTFVNGTEVESRLLKKGDVIEIGETKIRFEGV